MKRLLIGSLSLSLLAGMSYGLVGRGGAEPKARPAPVRHEGVAGLGYVEGARPEVPQRPEVSGVVARLLVRRGEQVRTDQLLAELGNESQRAQVDLAQAELERAEVDVKQAAAERESAQRAGAGTGIRKQDFDRAHFSHQSALKRLKEAQARLRSARAELAKTQLRAPYDCTVLDVNVEPGQRAGPDSAEPLLILADLSRRRVLAYVDEVDANRVAVGQVASVTVDGIPGRSFAGKVSEVKPRMGRRPLHSDAPDEYKDAWSRGVYVDLEAGEELPPNQRVKVKIQVL
jgi:RND family efflux transporter MFP subunit